MQTFLPYADFAVTAKCLDYRRLGKQRVEGMQLLTALGYIKCGDLKTINKRGNVVSRSWINHPATKMWIGCEELLKLYVNVMIQEWIDRGYNNSMMFYRIDKFNIVIPSWLGNQEFHDSHKSNLLRKDKEYYSRFNWNISDSLEYVWPMHNL